MSESKYHWKKYTPQDAIADAIRQNAKPIASVRLPRGWRLWVIGSFDDDSVRLRPVSYGEKPNPRDFEETDFLVSIGAAYTPNGIKRKARELAKSAIFPADICAKASIRGDDE